METATEQNSRPFVERRGNAAASPRTGSVERRQFTASPNTERPEVAELAAAVDHYKLLHRRRFITFEELFDVMTSLGYHR